MPNPHTFTSPLDKHAGTVETVEEVANQWFANLDWLKYVYDRQPLTGRNPFGWVDSPDTSEGLVLISLTWETFVWERLRYLNWGAEQVTPSDYTLVDALTFGR